MAKTKYFAIDANGAEHTRNTERVYSHAVVYRNQLSERLSAARDSRWERTDRSNYQYYRNLVNGTHTYSCITEADIERARAKTEGVTEEAYVASELAIRVERAQSGDYATWFCAGWSGRLDLAQKLAAKYTEAQILPAQTR